MYLWTQSAVLIRPFLGNRQHYEEECFPTSCPKPKYKKRDQHPIMVNESGFGQLLINHSIVLPEF